MNLNIFLLAFKQNVGKTEAVNLTAAQYLNEMNNSYNINEATNLDSKSEEEKESFEAVKAMEQVPPLEEQIKPLIEKISVGLSGMSKIVGAPILPKDITPGMLATFLATKQSSEENIIIHLHELNSIISTRLPFLQSMREHQKLQLERLQDVMSNLQKRIKVTKQKSDAILSNSKLLCQRSSEILTTARELTPSITEAEREHFKDVQRCENDCSKFEEQVKEVRTCCKQISDEPSSIPLQTEIEAGLTQEQKDLCMALLEDQMVILNESQSAMKKHSSQFEKILSYRGIDPKTVVIRKN